MARVNIEADKIVIFRVGREEYAVHIAAVREVVPWSKPTQVPDSPPMVEGVVDLRGEIIPVVDLGRIFKTPLSRSVTDARIIVMELDGQQAGFIVDDVSEVQQIVPESIAKPSPVLRNQQLAGAATAVVTGIMKMGENRLVLLVDPQRIIQSVQLSAEAAATVEGDHGS